MSNTPKLKQVWPSSPFRPLFNELNRAVEGQSALRSGSGFGTMGRAVRQTSEERIWAITDSSVPGAELDDPEVPIPRTIGKGTAFEVTLEITDDEARFVRAGPDDPTQITVFNPAQDSVQSGTLIRASKDFGLWIIDWVECSSGQNNDDGGDVPES